MLLIRVYVEMEVFITRWAIIEISVKIIQPEHL